MSNSWLLMKAPADIVGWEFPADYEPQVLGSRRDVASMLFDILPGAERSDDCRWVTVGYLHGTLEFDFGEQYPVTIINVAPWGAYDWMDAVLKYIY